MPSGAGGLRRIAFYPVRQSLREGVAQKMSDVTPLLNFLGFAFGCCDMMMLGTHVENSVYNKSQT